jgi:hypothetical protein
VFTAEWNKDKGERKREIARTDAGAAALPAARRIAEALQEGANADKTVSLPSDAYFHPTGENNGANHGFSSPRFTYFTADGIFFLSKCYCRGNGYQAEQKEMH